MPCASKNKYFVEEVNYFIGMRKIQLAWFVFMLRYQAKGWIIMFSVQD